MLQNIKEKVRNNRGTKLTKNITIFLACLTVSVAAISLVKIYNIKKIIADNHEYDSPLANLDDSQISILEGINVTKETKDQVNEKNFDYTIDLNTDTVQFKSEKASLVDFFNLTKEELENLKNNNIFGNYLEKNFTGDVKIIDNIISVSNPYSTHKLILHSDKNIDELKTKNIKKVSSELYIAEFDSAEDTKQEFKRLNLSSSIDVIKDIKVKTADIKTSATNTVTSITDNAVNNPNKLDNLGNPVKKLTVPSAYEAWGVASQNLDTYTSMLEIQENDKEIIVAVLDTGIFSEHIAFENESEADRITFEGAYDFVNDDNDPTDDDGHGTMVSGTITESTPANVKILPVKVMDENGEGSFANTLMGILQVEDIADIINLSLGFDGSDLDQNSLEYLDSFFQEAEQKGVITVAATGNDGLENVSYPGMSRYTIGVGATNKNETIADFSNYGEAVDFVMPGSGLYLPYYLEKNTFYTNMSGTSFATPFLAAAISLIKLDNESFSKNDVIQELKLNTKDLGDPGKDKYFGFGLVDFAVSKFAKPVFARVDKPADEDWAESDNLDVYMIDAKNLSAASFELSTVKENNLHWHDLGSDSNVIRLQLTAEENGVYKIWAKNTSHTVNSQEIIISNIDKTTPEITSPIQSLVVGANSVKLSIEVDDDASGVSEIDWLYKKNQELTFNIQTESYNPDERVKEVTLENLEPASNYQIKAHVKDRAGRSTESDIFLVTTLSVTDDSSQDDPQQSNDTPNDNIPNGNEVDVNLDVAQTLAFALVEQDGVTAADSINLTLRPESQDTHTSMLRVSTNSGYKIQLEMINGDTSLINEDGQYYITQTSGGGGLDSDSWGYSLDGNTFKGVKPSGSGEVLYSNSNPVADMLLPITFGAKASKSLVSGKYSGVVVFTAVPAL